MLSYLHELHAGNHADILKHVTLLYVLEYLNKKNKPYSFFDTHAGAGLYELDSEEALKTGEAARGIQKLLFQNNIPSELHSYVSFVKECLLKKYYPGSPAIEVLKALEGSSVFLTELHPKEYKKLESNISIIRENQNSSVVRILNESGWDILKKQIPPALKRGAVLCDPSYEELSDYHNAAKSLSEVHKKWSGSTLMLWYPLLANKSDEIDSMKQHILSTVKNRDIHTEVLDARLCIDSEDSHKETSLQDAIGSAKPRLYGSGMFVVNPSWGLSEHLIGILPYLAELLGKDGNGSYKVELL